ncbi:MAG TPA: AAA family ATPase [Rhizobium sp.]
MTLSKLKILYGPPGTGKTWRAAREAVRLIEPTVSDGDIMDRHSALVLSGAIIWVTFHPSYTYEDFVEGFRPEATENGILYKPRSGPFRIACENVTRSAPLQQQFYVGQEIKSSTGQDYEVVAASADNVLLRNKKGKGAGLQTPVSLGLISKLSELGYLPGDLSIPGSEHERKKEIAEKVGYDMQTLFGMTGPLRAVWEVVSQAVPPKVEPRKVVLVIDEINRADLSRVFGELITLLEQDKRLGAAEERRILLPYSQTLFGVPQQLNVIGTMNTSDRSLSTMDAALRRRFEFEEVRPDISRCAYPYASIDLRAILGGMNRTIAVTATRERQVGHAFFETTRLEAIREDRLYAKTPDGELRAVAAMIRSFIAPLLMDRKRTIHRTYSQNSE